MPEKVKRALVSKCKSGKLKPQKGRSCKDAAYAIMTAMEKKRGGK